MQTNMNQNIYQNECPLPKEGFEIKKNPLMMVLLMTYILYL